MEKLKLVNGYFADLRRILGIVNSQLYAIDPLYVTYEWVIQCFAFIAQLGPFLFAVIGMGYILETPEPSWLVVLTGIAGFATYQMLTENFRSWARERRRVFDALLLNRLKSARVEHVAKLDLGRLVDPAFIKLSQLTETRGCQSIQSLWSAQKDLLESLFTIVVSAIALLALDWLIGVIALCIATPSILKRWLAEQRRRELDEQETMIHRQRDEVYDAIASPKMTVLVRLLRLTNQFVARHVELTTNLVGNVRLLAQFERKWDFFIGLATLCCVVVFSLYFASGLVAGHYGFAKIGIIVGSLRLVAVYIGSFGWALGQLGQGRKDYQYLEQFFQTRSMVDEYECRPLLLKKAPVITVNDLVFSYPNQTERALDGCSIIIEPGEKIALVGDNGSGKTTFFQLLSRVRVATEGSICADGIPLNTVQQESWLNHVTMMTQGASLPGMEIIRAITGSVSGDVDHVRVAEALAFSRTSDIVAKLPLGLKTWIGEEWPDGKGFSAGQRERLVMAAMFYRLLDPNVFIALFDEPTANCDAKTKAKFYRSVTKAPEFKEKTVVVSLHDPLYLRFFDRVLQFETGRLVNDLRTREAIEAYQMGITLALDEGE